MIKLIILGNPQPKQSARFYRTNGFIRSYQPKKITDWVAQARFQIEAQIYELKKTEGLSFPLDGEIKIKSISFIFPLLSNCTKKDKELIQSGATIYKNTKPDLDNLQKLTYDSCNKLLWIDDARIVEIGKISKIFGLEPRIEIEI